MTPKERAAMQQALEAIGDAVNKALSTIQAALAEQAEQEPVGVVTSKALDGVVQWKGWIPREGTKLYAAPVQQAGQEPVAWSQERKRNLIKHWALDCGCDDLTEREIDDLELIINAVLNAAPVRTKDLTDDEIAAFWASDGFYRTPTDFARAVIAADREKNK